MKNIFALTLALGLSTTAIAADFSGEGTSHVRLDSKASSLSRADVVSKVDSASKANTLDSTVITEVRTPSSASRSDVVRKMEGYRFADFGDGTNPAPWKKSVASTTVASGDYKAKTASN